jgi:hypothetical protein
MSYAIYEKQTAYQCYRNDKKFTKKPWFSLANKCARSKKLFFFRENKLNDGLNKFFGLVSHTLHDAMILLGMESLRAAKCVQVRFWRPRRPRQLAVAVAETSSSRQALMLAFLANRGFLMLLVLQPHCQNGGTGAPSARVASVYEYHTSNIERRTLVHKSWNFSTLLLSLIQLITCRLYYIKWYIMTLYTF